MANPVTKNKVENLYLSNDVVVNVNLDDYAMLSDIPDMPDTTYFLDKRYGGTISGNVDIYRKDLKMLSGDINILSGNYVQTTDNVDMYGLKNAFIQANTYKESYGKSSVGSKGFYVLSVIGTNKLKLSGSINIPTSAYSKVWSISLDDKLNSQFSTIYSVDGQIVTFASPFDPVIQAKSISSESQLTALIAENDNAFYCPSDASIGNVVLNFYGQHAEGGSVHAIAQYSHAEGRATTAEGRYAHAEGGNGTTAGGLASHAEGFGTKALGNRSHSEGSLTYATMWAAHAEGSETSSLGNGSHSEGHFTLANGHYSHAEGIETSAIGSGSHVEGYSTIASAYYSHAEGSETSAVGNYSHVEGRSSIANGNDGAHAEGYMVSAFGGGSHAEGYRTLAAAEGSHVEGRQTYAAGKFAHAEGGGYEGGGYFSGGSAIGDGSHAEGRQTSAVGNYSHAEGRRTLADAENAHAAGYMSQANSANSTAIGRYAKVLSTDNNAFVWQGSTRNVYYESQGLGTFCINPINDINGFYIGLSSLGQILRNSCNSKPLSGQTFEMTTTQLSTMMYSIISALGGQMTFNGQSI